MGRTTKPNNQTTFEGKLEEEEDLQSSKGGRNNGTREVIYESKRKKKEKYPPGTHEATFSVVISMSIPSNTEETVTGTIESSKKKHSNIIDSPKAQNYYHIEYGMLPGEEEILKTDIVSFGPAAKFYAEKQESRVLKTFQSGNCSWIAWTQNHTIPMTEQNVDKLHNHILELRLWNQKDKCSYKAKFDRPKAFKLPKGEDDLNTGVGGLVLNQIKSFVDMGPKKLYLHKDLPNIYNTSDSNKKIISLKQQLPISDLSENKIDNIKYATSSENIENAPASRIQSAKKSRNSRASIHTPSRDVGSTEDGGPLRIYENLRQLANGMPSEDDDLEELISLGGGTSADLATSKRRQSINSRQSKSQMKAKVKKKFDVEEVERIKKQGVACIPINMAEFFAPGTTCVTKRLSSNVPGIEDFFITIKLTTPILSDEQIDFYNPLSIKIHCATNMPNEPYDYDILREICEPAFIECQFLNSDIHRSDGVLQDQGIYWDDTFVVLLGKIDPSKVREFLLGPHFEIKIHDRDKKIDGISKVKKPALFGAEIEDEKISNVGVVSSKRTLYNAFDANKKPWDPYGISRFDLSGLLLGQKIIYLHSPILPCKIPDVLGKEMKDNALLGIRGAVDGPEIGPMQQADYMGSGAELKIRVEVAKVLVGEDEINKRTDRKISSAVSFRYKDILKICPFNRLIYVVDTQQQNFLRRLLDKISNINAEALGLANLDENAVRAILSTFKLSTEQQQSPSLDIITGCQIIDKTTNILILEGLADRGLAELWAHLPQEADSSTKILYNSDTRFTERLYGKLDVDIVKIKLHEPLDLIIQQPLFYVRDMVPKDCFEALTKLKDILNCSKIRQICKNDLWPTANMIIVLSKEFGVPLTKDELKDLQENEEEKKQLNDNTRGTITRSSRARTPRTPLDNANPEFVNQLSRRTVSPNSRNFLAEHKKTLREISRLNAEERSKTAPSKFFVSNYPVHNYSSHTFNQIELAKEQIRDMIQSDYLKRYYSYCPDYHISGTFFPKDFDDEYRKDSVPKKYLWKTQEGWRYPGKQHMVQANQHPLKPDDARAAELKKEWEENSLHTNKFVPPVAQREAFSWCHRAYDFNLWQKAVPIDQGVPSIHPAGITAQEDKIKATTLEKQKWKEKLVTETEQMKFHRKNCKTEMTMCGSKSSNQIDKLNGLLKDEAKKVALQGRMAKICSIPPFQVVAQPSVDTQAREMDKAIAPAIDNEFEDFNIGFSPGERGKSLTVDFISRHDYDRHNFPFADDFKPRVNHKSKIYKKIPKPLSNEEYSNNLYQLTPDLEERLKLLPKPLEVPSIEELKEFYNKLGNEGCFLPPIS
ncbi:DgyrCDS4280 [Dimorphilus gyrociliatus]|uniref:DgyrCDS4280 n=1 Tax=Dimorphilus gyrociliatus TaxID=2664684 RepID=A0A7I8VHX8_9ANNE|nr:DgyrCDS4280 [Dimorphilus gyrociliatus]